MTIQAFVEKAIGGGWGDYGDVVPTSEKVSEWMSKYPIWFYKILLDPEAWKAVGKVEGWFCEYHRGDVKDGYSRHTMEDCADWKNKMHRMIDALADGKTPEEYLSTL